MRCPKCGYISFDHSTTCTKCRHDLEKAAALLHGTAMKVQAPNFLGPALLALAARAREEEDGAAMPMPPSAPETVMAEEAAAPDLEIRMEEQAAQAAEIALETPAAITVDESPDLDLRGLLPEEEASANEPAAIEMPKIEPQAPEPEAPAEPVTLQFEGLDLSDLAPPDSSVEVASQDGGEGEGVVFDMWSLESDAVGSDSAVSLPSGDDLLEDLLYTSKTGEEATDIDLDMADSGDDKSEP